MKSRKQILTEAMSEAVPKFELSLLTDEQLNDFEQIMKRTDVHYISIEKAVKQGFIIPNDPNEIVNNLIKFYKQ